jgi:hypothetical protein
MRSPVEGYLLPIDRPIGRANIAPNQLSQRLMEVLDVKERAAALAILLLNLFLGQPQGKLVGDAREQTLFIDLLEAAAAAKEIVEQIVGHCVSWKG